MAECRSCGKKLVWGETEDGKRIPLDSVAPVYQVVGDPLDHENPRVVRASGAYVTHFATCPNASEHSKSGTRRAK